MSAFVLFRRAFGADPDGIFSAPGRVNLIGEHTDYNNGLVLPFAIDARAEVAARRSAGSVVRVVSGQRPGTPAAYPVDQIVPGSPSAQGWSAYLFGVVWALREAGLPIAGVDLALDSTVPSGAGLSSSAAVECATVLALSQLFGVDLAPPALARIAQKAENDFVGVPCGLMDQMASSAARAGNLLFFDVGNDTTEHIPFDPSTRGLQVLVIDTRVHHALADGEYAKRRASCEAAAAELGIGSLREIDVDIDAGGLVDTLARLSDDVLRRRVRHIVTENARVLRVVQLLRSGYVAEIGPELSASHASMRDDYEISSVELDLAVETAMSAGALGARMTGGGFGGSAIALVPEEVAPDLTAAVDGAFTAAGFGAPVVRPVVPAAGARRDG